MRKLSRTPVLAVAMLILLPLVGATTSILAGRGSAQAVVDRDAHNWGRVVPGSKVETTSTISNAGRTKLTLGKPKASCGRAEPLLSRSSLARRERAELRVGFDVPTTSGNVSHTIRIPTNDPARPVLLFSLHAHAWRGVLAQPQAADFGRVAIGQTAERVLQLYAPDGGPFRIARITAAPPDFEAAAESPDLSISVHRVHVLHRANDRLGTIRDSIRVVTDRADAPWIDVPVAGRGVGRVNASPDSLLIEPDDVGKDVRRTVHLRAPADDGIPVLTAIEPMPPWRVVELRSRPAPMGRMLEVTIVAHFPEDARPVPGFLDLFLSEPGSTIFRVPISARGWEAPLPDARGAGSPGSMEEVP